MGSDSILQNSRLTGGGTVGGNPVLRAGVLRPSVLGPSRLGSALSNNSTTNNVTSSIEGNDEPNTGADGNGIDKQAEEKPNNPFLKDHKLEEDEEDNEQVGSEAGGAKSNDTGENNDEPDERPDPLSLLRKNGMERANLFAAAKSSIPLVEKSGFVFGQNVHERVVGVS